jgi:hypothetical protein
MSFSPWIKIETTLPDKPEVIAMAARLRMKDPDTVTGKLVRIWVWADANSIDGHQLAITPAFIDRLTACKGFAAAMEAVGWLVIGGDGLLSFPGFDRHNGDSAKKRATEARKKQKQRGGKDCDTGTNVPPPPGQTGGPEEEIELGERERAGGSADPKSPAAVFRRICGLRPEWSASPEPSDAEAAALTRNLRALQAIEPGTWAAMRDYLAAKLPEGSAGWQPRQRLRAIETAGDVAAQAMSWRHGAGAKARPAGDGIPAAFLTWAKERHPASNPRILWATERARADWEASTRGDAA